MIDFEKDQQEVIKKTDNIQSLADQVERLEQLQRSIEKSRRKFEEFKKEIRAFIWRSNSNHDGRDGFITS